MEQIRFLKRPSISFKGRIRQDLVLVCIDVSIEDVEKWASSLMDAAKSSCGGK